MRVHIFPVSVMEQGSGTHELLSHFGKQTLLTGNGVVCQERGSGYVVARPGKPDNPASAPHKHGRVHNILRPAKRSELLNRSSNDVIPETFIYFYVIELLGRVLPHCHDLAALQVKNKYQRLFGQASLTTVINVHRVQVIGLETGIRLRSRVPKLLVSPTSNPHTHSPHVHLHSPRLGIRALNLRFQPPAPTASRSQMCTYRALVSLVSLFSSSHYSLSLQPDTLSLPSALNTGN